MNIPNEIFQRCVEPPCGQLNPAIPELYPLLQVIRIVSDFQQYPPIFIILAQRHKCSEKKLRHPVVKWFNFLSPQTMFGDWLDAFSPSTFHIGQDEVGQISINTIATDIAIIIGFVRYFNDHCNLLRSTLAAGTRLQASLTGLSIRAEGGRFLFNSIISVPFYSFYMHAFNSILWF